VNELQQVVEDVGQALGSIENYGSSIVGISRSEARQLLDAAQLVPLLQERCELLGRALTAVWSLVDEEDQLEIAELLGVPAGAGKSLPAATIVQMLERKGSNISKV
jgi:hypothetical protein